MSENKKREMVPITSLNAASTEEILELEAAHDKVKRPGSSGGKLDPKLMFDLAVFDPVKNLDKEASHPIGKMTAMGTFFRTRQLKRPGFATYLLEAHSTAHLTLPIPRSSGSSATSTEL